MTHANNPALLNRLRRAEGHLAAVTRMIAEGRDGLSVAQQLQAVIRALNKTKHALIVDHIDHHLVELAGPISPAVRRKLSDMREITKYL